MSVCHNTMQGVIYLRNKRIKIFIVEISFSGHVNNKCCYPFQYQVQVRNKSTEVWNLHPTLHLCPREGQGSVQKACGLCYTQHDSKGIKAKICWLISVLKYIEFKLIHQNGMSQIQNFLKDHALRLILIFLNKIVLFHWKKLDRKT